MLEPKAEEAEHDASARRHQRAPQVAFAAVGRTLGFHSLFVGTASQGTGYKRGRGCYRADAEHYYHSRKCEHALLQLR